MSKIEPFAFVILYLSIGLKLALMIERHDKGTLEEFEFRENWWMLVVFAVFLPLTFLAGLFVGKNISPISLERFWDFLAKERRWRNE